MAFTRRANWGEKSHLYEAQVRPDTVNTSGEATCDESILVYPFQLMNKLIIFTPALALALMLSSCTTVVKEPATTATTTTTHETTVARPAATQQQTTTTRSTTGY